MQVSVEVKGELERLITVAVPAEEVESLYQKKLKDLKNKANLKGFRPGKVPSSLLEQRFGPDVRQEVISEVMKKRLFDAIKEQNLEVAGLPVVEKVTDQKNQPLEFQARVEVFPEVALTNFDQLKIDIYEAEVNDSDIDDALKKIQEKYATWRSAERVAQAGDRVTIDFDGRIDGQPLEHGSAKNSMVVIGDNNYIPGFESGLIGKKAEDAFTLALKFPEDYSEKKIAGKDVEFGIKVHKIEERELPELNQEFYKSLGLSLETESEFRNELKNNLERELKQKLQKINKDSVLHRVAETHQFSLPESMVKDQMEHMRKSAQDYMNRLLGKKGHEIDGSLFKEESREVVKNILILRAIIKQHKLEASAAKVRERIEEMASYYTEPEAMMRWYYSDEGRLESIQQEVLEQLSIDQILASAQKQVNNFTFKQAMEYKIKKPAEKEKTSEDVES